MISRQQATLMPGQRAMNRRQAAAETPGGGPMIGQRAMMRRAAAVTPGDGT